MAPQWLSVEEGRALSTAAHFTLVDWGITGFAAWCVVRGLLRGAIREIFGVAGAIAALLLAERQYGPVAIWMQQRGFAHGVAADLGAFLAIAAAVFAAATLLGRMLRSAVHLTGLGLLDRLAGGLLGLARATLIATLLTTALTAFAPTPPWLARSRLMPFLAHVAQILAPLAPADLAGRIWSGVDALISAWQRSR